MGETIEAVLNCKRQRNEDDDTPCPDCSAAAPFLARQLSRIRVCVRVKDKRTHERCGCIRVVSGSWQTCAWCGHSRSSHKAEPEEAPP